MEKIQAAVTSDKLYQVDVRAIRRPSQPFFPLFRFLRKVIKLRKSGTPLPRTPWVEDESLCTHCGLCVTHCPVGAIIKGDELHTDADKCIKCCACVKSCKLLLSACFHQCGSGYLSVHLSARRFVRYSKAPIGVLSG